ncbi:hypothetical protein ZIOFF_042363 [Zingiber officinale]|uniref:BHLH domain-containing protein n=1 Tax=Zingiber officinale TaxID=94328 RepID=A0A8J5KNN8_ZINOF|nr:hypothetical protein ZIOFF_042363 [Zingiber officinale]
MVALQFASFADYSRLVEKAVRFPCFNARNLAEAGKLSRISSSQSLMAANNGKRVTIFDATMEKPRFGGRVSYSSSLGASSVWDSLAMTGAESNGRKRLQSSTTLFLSSVCPALNGVATWVNSGDLGEFAENSGAEPRMPSPLAFPDFCSLPAASSYAAAEEGKSTAIEIFRSSSKEANYSKDKRRENSRKMGEDAKPLEPSKDYIHVRARRGQAIDSHNLDERVRREKISERMKLLQNLVPDCNKVTGKATMLDEIINYVQSLQRQIEFLSMKLSTLNSQLEFDMETLLPKDASPLLQIAMEDAVYDALIYPYLDNDYGPVERLLARWLYRASVRMELWARWWSWWRFTMRGSLSGEEIRMLFLVGRRRRKNVELWAVSRSMLGRRSDSGAIVFGRDRDGF